MVHDGGNFKYILHTLTTQYQLMLACYLKMASVFKQSTETGRGIVVSVRILDTAIKKKAIWKKFKGLDFVSKPLFLISMGL